MKSVRRNRDLDLFFNAAPLGASQMLSAEGISFLIPEKAPFLVEDFTISVGKRDRICIIGKNGKGKSTLLKVLAGELQPVAG